MKYLIAVVVVLVGPSVQTSPEQPSAAATVSCGTQSSLKALIAAPHDGKVKLKKNGCYRVAGITIAKTSGLSIIGNGATIERATLGTRSGGPSDPILELDNNTGLLIKNLTVKSVYAGKSGGPGFEGQSGIVLRGDVNTTLEVSVADVQGDGVDVYPDPTDTLNQEITLSHGSIENTGYHGIVLESVAGLTAEHETISHIAVDAVDAENDLYSTHGPTAPNIAIDQALFTLDTFRDWHDDLYASLQPQTPGVQERGVTISDDQLYGTAPLVALEGAQTGTYYRDSGFTFSDNVLHGAATSVYGGSPATPWSGSTMTFKDVYSVTITGNNIPVDYAAYAKLPPNQAVYMAVGVDGLSVTANQFPGVLGISSPYSSANTAVVHCSNTFGVGGADSDPACP